VLTQNITGLREGRLDPASSSALWAKKSGMEAGRLAESLQDSTVAINVYTDLKELLPGWASTFDRKILKASEHP